MRPRQLRLSGLPVGFAEIENQFLECLIMKLYASDNSDLMEISAISRDGRNLIVEGTIMGSMPIRAVVKPAEIRGAFKLMDIKTMWFAFTMLLRSSR